MDALIRRLAKRSGITRAQAADQIHNIIHDLVSRLKRGETARLPGVGKLVGPTRPKFTQEGADRGRRR